MIYFAQLPSGAIKIGYSADVPARMDQLRFAYGEEPALLRVMDGNRRFERELHERFAAHRLGRTEQFRPVAEILEFIGRPLLVGPNPDVVEVIADKRVAVIVLKGSSAYRKWLSGISKDTLIPVASIVRDAVSKWAKQRGYPDPPET